MDINNFGPFNTEVWGSVSDWLMFIVTTITAIYIYKTFNSQIKVQKDQQRITDIETERFRIEYKPIIDLTLIKINNILKETNIQSDLHFSLKIMINDCKNLNIKIISFATSLISLSALEQKVDIILPINFIYQPVDYDLYMQKLTQQFFFERVGGKIMFNIEYDDIIGNSYSQEFIYDFQDAIINDFSKNPERIFK